MQLVDEMRVEKRYTMREENAGDPKQIGGELQIFTHLPRMLNMCCRVWSILSFIIVTIMFPIRSGNVAISRIWGRILTGFCAPVLGCAPLLCCDNHVPYLVEDMSRFH